MPKNKTSSENGMKQGISEETLTEEQSRFDEGSEAAEEWHKTKMRRGRSP